MKRGEERLSIGNIPEVSAPTSSTTMQRGDLAPSRLKRRHQICSNVRNIAAVDLPIAHADAGRRRDRSLRRPRH